MRPLVLLFLVIAAVANAQPRFGEPQAIAPDLPVPAAVRATSLGGVRFGNGTLVAWADEKGVHVVRLDARGAMIDPLPKTITPSSNATNILVTTDGTDVLVGWTLGPYSGQADSRIVVLTEGTRHTVTQRIPDSLDALLYTGSRYLAITGGLNDRAEILELDHRAFIVSSASLGLGKSNSDPLQWNQGFFVDRGAVWLVTDVDGHLVRLAVTDANEKPQQPVTHPLGIDLPFDRPLHSAGTVDGVWYVVHGRPAGRHYVSFEGRAAPIPIDGFKQIDHHATRASGGEVYLFGTASDDARNLRGARVSPLGRARYFEVGGAGNLTAAASVPMNRGVVLLTASSVLVDRWNGPAPPAARFVRPFPRGERTLVQAPIVLAWTLATQSEATVAAHGAGFLAAWQQLAVDGIEVWTRLLDRDGKHAGEPRAVGRGATPKIASNGDVALVVSVDRGVVEARRFDATGKPVGDTIVLDRAPTARIISAGWDGAQFSVAWVTDTQVSATALTASGEVLLPEPVRLAEPAPAVSDLTFTVSPFGGLVLYQSSTKPLDRNTWGVRLGRDLRPTGARFLVLGISAFYPQTVWTGQEYIVTVSHANSMRAARVSPVGEALDAPYGLWLAPGGDHHYAGFGNGRLILVSRTGALATDRELRTPTPVVTENIGGMIGSVAIREDGAALFAYAAHVNGETTLAYVRTIP